MAAGLLDAAICISIWLFGITLLFYCMCGEVEEEDNVAADPQPPAPPPPPASSIELELGYFPYNAAVKGGASGPSAVCAICLEVLVEGALCSEVPACRHLFHRDCIHRWMKSKNTCPLCRHLIIPGSKPLSAAEDMV